MGVGVKEERDPHLGPDCSSNDCMFLSGGGRPVAANRLMCD